MRHGARPRRPSRGGGQRGLDLLGAISSIVIIAGLGVVAYKFNAPSRASGVSGYASVIDGDTIDMGVSAIRVGQPAPA